MPPNMDRAAKRKCPKTKERKVITMKQIRRTTALAVLLVTALGVDLAVRGDELKTDSEQAMEALQKADSSLKKLVDESAGYVIFPSVGRGGFIIGGERGKGLVYQNGKVIGEAKVTEINIGAQVGGESFSELILFQTSEALRDFKASNWEMSAKVNAVAAAEGAAKNAKFQQGVAVFTLSKGGLMVQATVGGQKFKFKPLE
jgi:lipid-binding SYLF domain-containing protein